jgi:hypothetical protein
MSDWLIGHPAGTLSVEEFVRADPLVRRLRFQSEMGEWCDILPNADDPSAGVVLFAILLPWRTGVVSMVGLDYDGQVLAQTRPVILPPSVAPGARARVSRPPAPRSSTSTGLPGRDQQPSSRKRVG